MRKTQQFSITLPNDMAAVVADKINSGAYASVSEVVRDGIRTLLGRDAAVEKWLRQEVVAGYTEYMADPTKGVAADQIMARITTRRHAAGAGLMTGIGGAELVELSRTLFGADKGVDLELPSRGSDRSLPDFD